MGTVSIVAKCPPVVIPDGEAVSQWVRADHGYGDSVIIGLYAPEELEAHAFIIEVAADADLVPFTAKTGSPAVNLAVPAANEAAFYSEICASYAFRIKDTTGNVGADRSFLMTKQHTA